MGQKIKNYPIKAVPVGADKVIGTDSATDDTVNFELSNFLNASDPDAIHDNIADEINQITEKSIPVADDLVIIEDSEDALNKKKLKVGNILQVVPIQEDDVWSSDQDNYALADIDATTVLRVTLDGADRDLTGIVPPSPAYPKKLTIINADTGKKIKVMHNDGGSVAANRFFLTDNGDFDILKNGANDFVYDPTSSRWRVISVKG